MHTIISGLLAGLVVGIICVIYVLARSRKMENDFNTGKSIPYPEGRTSVGLMIMAIFGSGSMVWGFLGAGLYHLIHAELTFLLLSIALTVLFTFTIWRSRTTFARDKMLLTIIIFIGLGILIPLFYDTLKIFE
ncbi:MAG: hypothetical protein ONB44_20730 [candidate division KSB1 bacterium]|nr:hypothetical protein [candidate division KSB1 bacterium]MDZ7304558.1 hypothetical protein [candidate division KSB1 bacterium]MDZ7313727.1 hypothetical protein [candidate division KSB1 bacterium]